MKALLRFSGPGSKLVTAALVLSLLALAVISTPALAAPGVAISPRTGAAGTVATITGSLFDSYKGDTVYVFFNDAQIDYSPFSVPDTGTFEVPFIVPEDIAPGTYVVKVAGKYDGTEKIAETTFTVESTNIYLDIVRGPVGTTVTVSGTGFYAGNEVEIYFYTPSPIEAGTEKASDIGRFDFHYVIPACTAGTHAMTATNTKGDQAQASFEVIPVITLNAASGGPGEQVTGVGRGFGAKQSYSVTIGARSVASGTTDAAGSFEFSFYVPNIKANLYEITVQDTAGYSDIEKFTVTAGAALSPVSGHIGTETTIRGDGFAPGGTISIHFGGTLMTTVNADNNGGFVTSFTIPAQAGGPHTVAVSDGATVKEFTFTIETIAPPAPALLLPANGSQTGRGITFDWNEVTDDSPPVTYDLQVATDEAFTALVVEKNAIVSSTYTLSANEEPSASTGPAAYFWRIRATDGAGNAGEWTAAWSFLVSPPGAPALNTAVAGAKGDEILLDWEDITTPNGPVTYMIEVSADQTFGTTVVQEDGITTSEFVVAGEAYSALKSDTPYFWRVRAVDGASVTGEWSENGIFSIAAPSSAFPTWAIFAIAGIGIIIIAYLAFRMGRRTGGEKEE